MRQRSGSRRAQRPRTSRGTTPTTRSPPRSCGAAARTRLSRGAAIQALKRSPVNLRPLLGVPKRATHEGAGPLAAAYTRLGRSSRRGAWRPSWRHGRSPTETGGWAYDFDVQTRWGFYPRGQPNAVVTAFAAHALLDVAERGREPVEARRRGRALRREAAPRRPRDGLVLLLPRRLARSPIHNASLLVAALMAAREPGSTASAAAEDAVAYTLERQRPDGSWPYGEATAARLGGRLPHRLRPREPRRAPAEGARAESTTRSSAASTSSSPGCRPGRRPPRDARVPLPAGHARVRDRDHRLVPPRAHDERALPTAERILDWTLRACGARTAASRSSATGVTGTRSRTSAGTTRTCCSRSPPAWRPVRRAGPRPRRSRSTASTWTRRSSARRRRSTSAASSSTSA